MGMKDKMTKTMSLPRWALLILIIILIAAGYYVGQHLSVVIDINTSWR